MARNKDATWCVLTILEQTHDVSSGEHPMYGNVGDILPCSTTAAAVLLSYCSSSRCKMSESQASGTGILDTIMTKYQMTLWS